MMMNKNPILDELRSVREQLLADAGGTLDALVDRLQTEEQKSDRRRFKPRQISEGNGAANSRGLAVEDQSSPPE
jgi:hypothetical protein